MIPPVNYPKSAVRKAMNSAARTEVEGRCVCGDVVILLAFPAFWAWHDHSSATRHAHGAAYATYVGAWKSRVRVLKGEAKLARFENVETGTSRKYCKRCGTPIFYERRNALRWINMPRALLRAHRARAALSHRACRGRRMGIPRRATCATEGLSRGDAGAHAAEEAIAAARHVMTHTTGSSRQLAM
jgi:hypothetical protein